MSFPDGSLRIETLAGRHDRTSFECGAPSLDRYLREQAGQDVARGIARVFVATRDSNADAILGFYALSAATIGPAALPGDVARRMPRHQVPAALVGRLAVDRRHAGQGLGRILLADAVLRTDEAARHLGIAVVVVDPIDEAARGFYAGFGFRVALGTRQMFLVRKPAGQRP